MIDTTTRWRSILVLIVTASLFVFGCGDGTNTNNSNNESSSSDAQCRAVTATMCDLASACADANGEYKISSPTYSATMTSDSTTTSCVNTVKLCRDVNVTSDELDTCEAALNQVSCSANRFPVPSECQF